MQAPSGAPPGKARAEEMEASNTARMVSFIVERVADGSVSEVVDWSVREKLRGLQWFVTP